MEALPRRDEGNAALRIYLALKRTSRARGGGGGGGGEEEEAHSVGTARCTQRRCLNTRLVNQPHVPRVAFFYIKAKRRNPGS